MIINYIIHSYKNVGFIEVYLQFAPTTELSHIGIAKWAIIESMQLENQPNCF